MGVGQRRRKTEEEKSFAVNVIYDEFFTAVLSLAQALRFVVFVVLDVIKFIITLAAFWPPSNC